jgi:hypothetical protein
MRSSEQMKRLLNQSTTAWRAELCAGGANVAGALSFSSFFDFLRKLALLSFASYVLESLRECKSEPEINWVPHPSQEGWGLQAPTGGKLNDPKWCCATNSRLGAAPCAGTPRYQDYGVPRYECGGLATGRAPGTFQRASTETHGGCADACHRSSQSARHEASRPRPPPSGQSPPRRGAPRPPSGRRPPKRGGPRPPSGPRPPRRGEPRPPSS